MAEPVGRSDPHLELTQDMIGYMDGARLELRAGLEYMNKLRGKTMLLNDLEPNPG